MVSETLGLMDLLLPSVPNNWEFLEGRQSTGLSPLSGWEPYTVGSEEGRQEQQLEPHTVHVNTFCIAKSLLVQSVNL